MINNWITEKEDEVILEKEGRGKEDSKRVITWVPLSMGRVAKGDDFDSAADVLMVKKIN